MGNLLTSSALVFMLICSAGSSIAAPVVSLVPAVQRVMPPDFLSMDVLLSGLGSGSSRTTLGAFDLTVHFDPVLVNLLDLGTVMGTGLGDPFDPSQTITGIDIPSSSSFHFYEVSLLEASLSTCVFCVGPYLDDLQSDHLVLASLLFYAPGIPGHTVDYAHFSIDSASAVLGDALGNPISGVQYLETTVTIPEPGLGLLLITALGAAGLARRFRPS